MQNLLFQVEFKSGYLPGVKQPDTLKDTIWAENEIDARLRFLDDHCPVGEHVSTRVVAVAFQDAV